MLKISILAGVLLFAASGSATAQFNPNVRDGTNNVRSDTMGTPASPTVDPMSQYQQQKALNNLPRQKKVADQAGGPRPATAAELIHGATVHDSKGIAIATIQSVDADGVVVSTAAGKVKVPADAFGHNKDGLMLDMRKEQFEQIVAKANASPNG